MNFEEEYTTVMQVPNLILTFTVLIFVKKISIMKFQTKVQFSLYLQRLFENFIVKIINVLSKGPRFSLFRPLKTHHLAKCVTWPNASLSQITNLTKVIIWRNVLVNQMCHLANCITWRKASFGQMY